MAATLTQERFSGPEWIFERKFDGIRLLAFKQGTDVRPLLTEPARCRMHSYPRVVAGDSAALPVTDVILDGEATGVWGQHGRDGLSRVRRAVARRGAT